MSKFVICQTCDQLGHRQGPESFNTFSLTLIWLGPSAVNPIIDQLRDRVVQAICDISMSWARFQFWTTSHFFMCLGDHPTCVDKLNFRISNPYQRETTAPTPCSSVSRGEYTSTLGQV